MSRNPGYFLTFLAFVLFAATPLGAAVSAQEPIKAVMVYLMDGIDDLRYKDGRIAFSMWAKDMATEENVELDIRYVEEEKGLYDGFIKEKFHYVGMNPIFYLRHKERLDPYVGQSWIMQRSENSFERMLLLVRRDSGLFGVGDLKGKKIVTRRDNYMGQLFLDVEMLQQLHEPAAKYVGEIEEIAQYSTAVLRTYFKKADACIVPEYAFELVAEMNPAIRKELMPIVRSDALFIPMIVMFHVNTGPGVLEAFARNVANLEHTARGRNILDLFKMKKARRVEPGELSALKAYYDRYLELQKRYGR